FNINTINKRLPNLLRWLKTRKPDIVCLQELKCAQDDFPQAAIRKAGYYAVWRGERAWNGVAILSRRIAFSGEVGTGSPKKTRQIIRPEPIVTRTALPGDPNDKQSRYIEAAVDGILIGCLYLPNGNPQPGPKFDTKLKWMSRLRAHAKKLIAQKVPLILAGDYNVAPTDIDIYPTTSWNDDALIQPAARAAYKKLVALGFTDALRAENPGARVYTFWHYMRKRWERDAGLRLDHLLLSPALKRRFITAGVDRSVRGEPGASDHAPVWVEVGMRKPGRS
ncbi:MAG: exodeoxyribonuclease III, partial [Fimbriimonadaceae bacterium]|nr:exodeoxyribonuclease III [Alphaproteobacteria bacterium]